MAEPPAILEQLREDPTRFDFDAAIRVLLRSAEQTKVAEAVQLVSAGSSAYPGAPVVDIDTEEVPPRLTLGLPGLVGAGGVLPRHYAEVVEQGSNPGFAALLQWLGERMYAALAQAALKYRLERGIESARYDRSGQRSLAETALLSLAGFGGKAVASRLADEHTALLHYSGLFTYRQRSASGLVHIVADWLGQKVEVVEFAGLWLDIEKAQQTRLPRRGLGAQHCQLGIDAAIGARAWDPHARVVLRIGPLDRDMFEMLSPGQPVSKALVALVRAYLGLRTAFAIQLVVKREQVSVAHLAPSRRPGASRLGWNTWLARSVRPARDADSPPVGLAADEGADDACFEAFTIERHWWSGPLVFARLIQGLDKIVGPDAERGGSIAVALWLTTSRAGGEVFVLAERSVVARLLRGSFDLDEAALRRLFDAVEPHSQGASGLLRFARALLARAEAADRITLLKTLWDVAPLDGVVSREDEEILRHTIEPILSDHNWSEANI